jgi:hypothetical protein
MKRLFVVIVLTGFMILSLGHDVFAGEIDLLLQKLVEKGILSAGEAQTIKTETQEQVKKEISQGKYSSLPQWVQTIKMKGDFRLRYQYDHAKKLPNNSQSPREDQHRARIRLRLGTEAKVNDKLKVGVGICTGGTTDPRSTNQTLGGSWTKKSIVLDYAYAEYAPKPWVTLLGGKFQRPLWEPGDLIWDTDITPEGAAAQFTYKLSPETDFFANAGVLIIGEAATDEADPVMYALQTGFNQKLFDSKVKIKGAFSFYDFTGVTNKALTASSGTNTNTTGTAAGLLLKDFKNITPALEIGITEPFKAIGLNIPYLAFFGEYVQNIATNVKERGTGFMGGFKFGAEKVEKWADWQFGYNYAMLGKDAILDILPDSDRYGGWTGMRSHEAKFDFGLGKNTWLGFDAYYGWRLPGSFAYAASGDARGTQTRPATCVQVDWNLKW